MTFEESMDYIQSFSKSGAPIRNLSRIKKLLSELGNPEQGQSFVHIAGTNGKGSTLALSSAAAIEAGFKTGQFTSPYMVRYNDRIRINNKDIPDNTLARLCTEVAACDVASECSQFEITFAIALLYFKEENCDLVFLETGLGGILDATNVIESPLVTAITSISYDHTSILGNTIRAIALQKAGIIKRGCPVILSTDNSPEINKIVAEKAEEKLAELRIPDFAACTILNENMDGISFMYHCTEYTLKMPGIHQVYNALTAIEIVRMLSMHGYLISARNTVNAFMKVQVPARIQQIGENPTVLLDGSHNEASVEALAEVIRNADKKPVILICGMLRTKDYKTSCHILDSVADYVICTDDFSPYAVNGRQLAMEFPSVGSSISYKSSAEALPFAKKIASEMDGIIIICGSLYLASQYLGLDDEDVTEAKV